MRSTPIASITLKPSMPGICRSRNTRSGDDCRMRLDRFRPGRRRAGDLDAGLGGEQRHQPLARHRLIVGDEDANHHATAVSPRAVRRPCGGRRSGM